MRFPSLNRRIFLLDRRNSESRAINPLMTTSALAPDVRQWVAVLYDAQVATVYGYLVARCGSHVLAEDLTAEVFLDAARLYASGGDNDVIDAGWLRMVARRRLIDHWRRAASQRRRIERLQRERPPDLPNHDRADVVRRALESLAERQRAAIVLRYLDDLSVSEVAVALGETYRTTESLLARGRRAFRAAYEELA